MARDITTINQINLWGKQADAGTTLEPQRSDLWMVDFKAAVQGVGTASKVPLIPILPQYVRAITLPELRTKAEPIRRDSVPYQMPSWDDPLDPIKITFLLDTHAQEDVSNVIQFLDAWMALTRAGRGTRFLGYNVNTAWLTLNSDFRVDFQYQVDLWLLRGSASDLTGGFSTSPQSDEFKAGMANANTAFRNQKKQEGQVQQGATAVQDQQPVTQFSLSASLRSSANPNMTVHSIYTLVNAWLGAYKMSDLNYAQSDLVTVEATFYADDVRLDTLPQFDGEPKII